MRTALVVAVALVLMTGCKSDADKCVDAVMTSFDNEAPDATKERRDLVKASAHINCQGKD